MPSGRHSVRSEHQLLEDVVISEREHILVLTAWELSEVNQIGDGLTHWRAALGTLLLRRNHPFVTIVSTLQFSSARYLQVLQIAPSAIPNLNFVRFQARHRPDFVPVQVKDGLE